MFATTMSMHADRGELDRDAKPFGERQEGPAGEGDGSSGTRPSSNRPVRQSSKQQVGIGHGRLGPADAVAGRAGFGAGTRSGRP
jgi:hypothetical protein